jgi:hypothetical protein
MPPIGSGVRSEFFLPKESEPVTEPPLVHYPEKAILEAALELWPLLDSSAVGGIVSYWMGSDDKDIRKWAASARGKLDPVKYRFELIQALADPNHKVRAAAATALLNSGVDLKMELSPEWRQTLQAYQLVGEIRFADALTLGRRGLAALLACISGDDSEVARDAMVVLRANQTDVPAS